MRRWLGSAAFLGLVALSACTASVREFGSGGATTTSTTSTASTASTTQTGGGGNGTGGTGTVYKGPKLVKSVPANADGQAGLDPFFFLYFDRPMSYSDATGKIKLTSDLVQTPTFAQVVPCPDGDATCVAGVFPNAFADPANQNGNHLPGGTKHTITVDKSFADPDGNAFDADVVVSFTTFKYSSNIFDDSGTIAQEAGGIEYDPASKALFLCGVDSGYTKLYVRRIPILSGGALGSASTYATPDTTNTGGVLCYGLDLASKKLYVSHTYGARVLEYDQLALPMVTSPANIIGPTTTLPGPDAKLDNVHSVTSIAGGSTLLFASGYYYVVPAFSGILSFGTAGWGVFAPTMNLLDVGQGFTIASGVDAQGEHVYAVARDKIVKLGASSKMLENQHKLDTEVYDPQIRTDSKGRLYVGDNNRGITVFDTSGATGFKMIAARPGLRAGRFALAETGNDVAVYFLDFRGKGIIGTTLFQF